MQLRDLPPKTIAVGTGLAILIASGLSTATMAERPVAAAQQLIPRAQLFGAPERSLPQVSPDGRRLAYLAADADGTMNLWLSRLGGSARAVRLSREAKGVFGYRWAEDDVHILFWRDADGDENWRLFALDVRDGRVRPLTPAGGIKAQNLLTDADYPHEILIGLNLRDRRVTDMYRIDIDSGATRLDTLNPGDVIGWTADGDFHIRAATAFVPDSGATVLRVRDSATGAWRDLASWPFHQAIFLGQLNGGSVASGFSDDGRAVIAVSPSDVDAPRLVAIDTATRTQRPLAEGPCGVAETIGDVPDPTMPDDYRPFTTVNPRTGQADAVAFECAMRSWHALDPHIGHDLTKLAARLDAFPYLISRDRADRLWVVAAWSGDRPVRYSLYDRASGQLRQLFSEHPELDHWSLPKPIAFEITARDGLKLPVYVTRKSGAPPGPMILLPHGGPWYRDHADFDPLVQLLADRGYTVLQVEYRGSVGFGTTFLNAGDHEYGLKMRDDLIDAAEWAVARRLADPGHIGVMGLSTGGYLSLRVAEARPDLFRATVDIVGPTDLKHQMESMATSWLPVKTRWLRRVGDVVNDPALNAKLSPRFDAPMPGQAFLIAQGANDPRVDPRNSDAIAASLRSHGATVAYVVYLDEGHGFVKPANNLDFYGRVEAFFARALGGRAEPWRREPDAHVEVRNP